MKTTLAICTVVYENYEVLHDFIKSLEIQTNQNFHLFIADTSKHPQKIESTVPFTHLKTKNKGYAHGINVCLEKALKKELTQFCIINNDTYFNELFVQRVISSLEKHPDSIIGGKIYYASGFEYHKQRYTKNELGKIIWYAGGTIDWNNVYTHHIGVDEVDTGQFDTIKKTDFITGCLTCFDKTVLDSIGYWDAEYFLYYEDTDFCERAKRKGITLYYDPSIILWHKNAQSTDGSGSELHEHYQNKNRVRFGLKYAPLRTKMHLLKNAILKTISF